MREASSRPNPVQSTWPYRMLVLLVVGAVLLAVGFLSSPTWGSVVALGLVEGLTEFLPISSTAHLLISAKLLGFQQNIGGTFEVFIQLGAILAVIGYYARDLTAQARALPTSAAARRFWAAIIVAFLPAALVGLALHRWIKQVLFASPSIIAWALIAGGVVFIAVERWHAPPAQARDAESISLRQALSVGVAQIFALIPGVSRSGASIVGGMLSGLDRSTATTFSFYLAIPTLGAATVVDLFGSLGHLTSGDIGRLAVGTLVSMMVAWITIGWLLRYVTNHSFVVFGIYRIIVGIAILALVAVGVL
jgi:undecaprenyl-diphosphatase